MTLRKRILSAVLCLCLVYTMIPVTVETAEAADTEVKPHIVIDDSKVHKQAQSGSDIRSTTYTPGRADTNATGDYTITDITNGQRIRFSTEQNKYSEIYIVPFTTSLEVPANTTCTVTQTFKFYGGHQSTNSNLAVAAASFQLLNLNGATASDMTVTARTKKYTNYGSSKGTVFFGGSRYGKSGTVDGDIKTVRQFEMTSKSDKVLTLEYKNNTNTKKTVSYNFAFWGSTQYAATYPNRFLIGFDILFDQVTTEKVTFNTNGGSVSTTSKTVTFGKTYGTLPTPTLKGHHFDGWYTAKTGGTLVDKNTIVDTFGSHTLYAHWTVNRYMITFDATGGKGYFVNKYVTYGEPYGILPTPTKPGYDLVGWFTKETGGNKVEETDIFTLGTTQKLYAQWTPAKYTVKFADNDYTYATRTVTYGSPYGELPTATGLRQVFLGWFTEENGKGTKIEEDTIVTATEDHTLYALFMRIPSIKWPPSTRTTYYGLGREDPGLGDHDPDDGYTYEYVYYQCDDVNGTNPREVGRTDRIGGYTTSTDLLVGDYYFYVVVTGTDSVSGASNSVTSPVITLTVQPTKPTPNQADYPTSETIDMKKSARVGDYKFVSGTMLNPYTNKIVPGTYMWKDVDEKVTETGSWTRIQVIFTPDDLKNYTTAEISVTPEVICSHEDSDFVDTGKVYKEATCTEGGRKQQKCQICGGITITDTPPLGHDYAWEYNDTQHWQKCSRCDNTDAPADHVFSGLVCETCGYAKPQVITVTITWNDMAFTYTDGPWNPEKHEYTDGRWSVDVRDGGMITVVNAGNTDINVVFTYEKANTDSAVEGSFVDDTNAPVEGPLAVAVGEKKYAWLLLSGKPEHDMQGETVGTVTVRLGGTT